MSKVECSEIAQKILSLSLVEAAELAAELKRVLNLPDVAMAPAAAAAPAPSEPVEKKSEATKFTLILKGYGEKKTSAIKALKTIFKQELGQDLGLKELKDKVEAVPVDILSGLTKEKADAYAKILKEAECEPELKGE
ncbi:ribosomal protein L7/L12 [Neorickettsia findlayensis]|uniref:50S ribosomal protein L7/L12 n=1 Tax=Neorickettsia findlayensis TaxID=2686014 RepID=A0A6P1GA34_9RICK|nr:ribosomal protein L7/L12 [Neorickettsia findlayensis]QHD65349.1 ribosomal protein L7/L12 [Neorickettsia findlayensis]